jgi:hypothetical protein
MNLNIKQVEALFKINPQITIIRGDVATDANGNEVAYDLQAVTAQAQKDACSMQAKQFLQASDWASLSDVDLTNKADFIAYRATLRNLALNPVENPTFPTEPTPVWS